MLAKLTIYTLFDKIKEISKKEHFEKHFFKMMNMKYKKYLYVEG